MQSRARIYRRNCRNHSENSIWGITYQYHSTLSSERCSWSILGALSAQNAAERTHPFSFFFSPNSNVFHESSPPLFFFFPHIRKWLLDVAYHSYHHWPLKFLMTFSLFPSKSFQLSTQNNKIRKRSLSSPFYYFFMLLLKKSS